MDLNKNTFQNIAGGGSGPGSWYDQSLPGEPVRQQGAATPQAVNPSQPQSNHVQGQTAPGQQQTVSGFSASPAPAVPAKPRKNRTGIKVFSVICSVLILIAASVYVFSGKQENTPQPSSGSSGGSGSSSSGSGRSGSSGSGDSGSGGSFFFPQPTPDAEEDLPGDFRERLLHEFLELLGILPVSPLCRTLTCHSPSGARKSLR